jgi:hypothetical protein
MVGLGGLEPPTSPLSGVRSNQAELQTRIGTGGHFNFYPRKIKAKTRKLFHPKDHF